MLHHLLASLPVSHSPLSPSHSFCPSSFLSFTFSPIAVVLREVLYIDVRKGGMGGVAMLLAGYCILSYTCSFPHIKHDRWRKYH
uniref:Uncharacterized protein n=1 Tax=Hucho hucho TaxID=62062 RepID=A0A4W5NAD3_9TELE